MRNSENEFHIFNIMCFMLQVVEEELEKEQLTDEIKEELARETELVRYRDFLLFFFSFEVYHILFDIFYERRNCKSTSVLKCEVSL